MAGADTIIVDFQALDSAISKFHTIEGQITSLASALQSNSASLQAAWISDASNSYADKMTKLIANVNKASESLGVEVQELQRLVNLEKEAEAAAKAAADSVSDFTMQ